MTVQERCAHRGVSERHDRFLSRAAWVALTTVSVFCQIAPMAGAAPPVAAAVLFAQDMNADNRSLPSSLLSDSYRPRVGSRQSAISGVIIALNHAHDPVTISGWFHIIWNGTLRYRLVDDKGESIDLLIDERVLRDAGGPLSLDRKRVQVIGLRPEKAPWAFHVTTINPVD